MLLQHEAESYMAEIENVGQAYEDAQVGSLAGSLLLQGPCAVVHMNVLLSGCWVVGHLHATPCPSHALAKPWPLLLPHFTCTQTYMQDAHPYIGAADCRLP